MPIVSVHKNEVSYSTAGAQYILDEVHFPTAPDVATVYLSRNIYSPGRFVLFDYSESSSLTPVNNFSQLAVDISDLPSVSSYSLSNDTFNKCIVVSLVGSLDNGTQYVEGTLTISNPISIHLSSTLYVGPGTYTLFTYGTFVGSVTNITIYPPPGLYVDTSISPNGCAISGSSITVKLI